MRALVLASLFLTGCVLSPLDFTGRACPCAAGFVEDRSGGSCICVIDARDAGSRDTAGRDGPAEDAPLADAPDLSVCDPGCHPTTEVCRAGVCEVRSYVDGERGTPTTSITLPPSVTGDVSAGNSIYLDFDRGDLGPLEAVNRIRIPAGRYGIVELLNLPCRGADDPLVFTNVGGQVRMRELRLSGGCYWVVTGRYDPVSVTGDPGFLGHAVPSRDGAYGIVIDGETTTTPGAQDGFVVAPSSTGLVPTRFELDFFEVRSAQQVDAFFWGRVSLGGGVAAGVRVRDLYVHDVSGAGDFSVGDASSELSDFSFHDNRILRTGRGCISARRLTGIASIRHNTFAQCSLDWRTLPSQPLVNLAVGLRSGVVRLTDNVNVGAPTDALRFFDDSPVGGAGIASIGGFFGDASHDFLTFGVEGPGAPRVLVQLHGARFRRMVFRYDLVDSMAVPGAYLFRSIALGTQVDLRDVQWDAEGIERVLPATYDTVTTDPTSVMATTLPPLGVSGFLPPIAGASEIPIAEVDRYRELAGGSPIVYAAGSLATFRAAGEVRARLYRSLVSTSTSPPEASSWEDLGAPTDDVWIPGTSPYAGMGVR